MAITTLSGLIAAMGQRLAFYKTGQLQEAAGTWHSLWAATGMPGAGATPASAPGAVPTSATTGALSFVNPTSGKTYVVRADTVNGQALILYDRLWHCGGLVGNIITSQNVNSSALTRPDANGDGVELWGEVYTAMGATGSTFTATYTNQAGAAPRSATYTMPANALSVGQMFPFTLDVGDTGVRKVLTVSLTPSTGTAGNFGLTLLRRVAEISQSDATTVRSTFSQPDFAALGMAQVYDDACLALMLLCNTTVGTDVQGYFTLAQG